MKNVKRGYFVQVLDKSLLLISENLCKCSLSKVFYLVIAVSLEVQYTVYIENGCKLFFVIFFILHWGQQEVLTTVSFTMLYFYFCVCLYCCFFCLFVVFFQWCFFLCIFLCVFSFWFGGFCVILFLTLHDLLKYFLLSNLEKFESLFNPMTFSVTVLSILFAFFQCISVTDA